MAGPFKFKSLKEAYNQSIEGKQDSLFNVNGSNTTSKELASKLKEINTSKDLQGFTAPLVKRFNYIKKNQENILNYFKTPEGIEFVTKQELLYKSAQYLAPVKPGQGILNAIPGIPVVSSIINSIAGNYNIHRDFSLTNMIGQIGLSSLGLQGKQANFANRVSDFSLKSMASLFMPAVSPATQSVYSSYINDITGRSSNLGDKLLNLLGINSTTSLSNKDRLVILYNQLSSNPTGNRNLNLDYDFNQSGRNKSTGFYGLGSFYNERSERHIVSKPVTAEIVDRRVISKSKGELTPGVSDYFKEHGIGPIDNVDEDAVFATKTKIFGTNLKPYDATNTYTNKLWQKPQNTIYFYRTGRATIGEKNTTPKDILNKAVLSKNIGKEKNDLIRFSIEFGLEEPSKSSHIQFRAYLNNISDNSNAQYASTRYVGRADQLHTYEGFTRTIGSGFSIYSGNDAETKIILEKLNTLTSLLTPSYSKNKGDVKRNFSTPPKGSDQRGTIETILGGVPRAPIIKLTIGNYLKNQYGFITGLSYSIKPTTPWDIDMELPQIIEVSSFSFTPIHNFVVSQEKSNKSKFIYIQDVSSITSGSSADVPLEIDPSNTNSFLDGGYETGGITLKPF